MAQIDSEKRGWAQTQKSLQRALLPNIHKSDYQSTVNKFMPTHRNGLGEMDNFLETHNLARLRSRKL